MGLECQILLDKATKNYSPGEIIYGRITIVNDQPRNVKGLQLYFEGKCSVKFSENEQRIGGSINDNTTVDYRSEEKYLDYTLDVFGNAGSDVLIPMGRFEYPFQFNLPIGLPSTYEGSYGKINYKVKAILPRSWAFDCRTTTDFRISGLVDLNFHPEAQHNLVLKQYKNFGWVFSKGDIGFVFNMPKRGAVIGGFVPFMVEINNKSPKIIKSSVSIIQEVKFFARGKHRYVEEVICKVHGPVLPPGGDEVWVGNGLLQVPFVPPTKLGGGCHLIDITYAIKMKLSAPGLFSNVEAQSPIVIGTIPFLQSQSIPHDPPPPYQPQGVDLQDSDFSLIDPITHASPTPAPAPSAPALPQFYSKS